MKRVLVLLTILVYLCVSIYLSLPIENPPTDPPVVMPLIESTKVEPKISNDEGLPPEIVTAINPCVLYVAPLRLTDWATLPKVHLTPSEKWIILMCTTNDELEIQKSVEEIVSEDWWNSAKFAFNTGLCDRIYTAKDDSFCLLLIDKKVLKTGKELDHVIYNRFPLIFPVYNSPIGEVRFRGTITVQLNPDSNRERSFNDVKKEADDLGLTIIEHNKDYVKLMVSKKVKHRYRNPAQLAEFMHGEPDLLLPGDK